jgi:hypothetical protein
MPQYCLFTSDLQIEVLYAFLIYQKRNTSVAHLFRLISITLKITEVYKYGRPITVAA